MTDPAAHIREAFRQVTLGLLEWQDPPELTPQEHRRLEGFPRVYRPWDPQGDVDPYDVSADWEERA